VGDLRTLALADAGELELIKRKIDLNPLVSSVVERFNPKASQRKVGLVTDLDSNCASIEVDPERIEQILSNLVDNALRYTPGGSNFWVKTVCSKNSARISVRDSGPGIPADKIQLVFDRFYREDRSRSEDGEGTGLGLAIARKLAEAHGGTLSAANHPEGGAVFTLKLPLQSKAGPSQAQDKAYALQRI
jgi:signal transduction histidine kinase